MSDSVLYEVADGVATITLNRPDAMNSLTTQVKTALRAAVERARDDSAARAVILTANGRAFCVGQDLREHAAALTAGHGLADTVTEHYNPITLTLAEMPKPVIAAVNGVAAGAGVGFALACDLRIVSANASFTTAFTKIGLAPDSGLSWTLQRLVGRGKATELLLISDRIPAEEALRLGLVTRVVPADQVHPQARALAKSLAAGPTAAYGATKAALAYAATADLTSALEKEAELQDAMAATADHATATAAFLKKEQPRFDGR